MKLKLQAELSRVNLVALPSRVGQTSGNFHQRSAYYAAITMLVFEMVVKYLILTNCPNLPSITVGESVSTGKEKKGKRYRKPNHEWTSVS